MRTGSLTIFMPIFFHSPQRNIFFLTVSLLIIGTIFAFHFSQQVQGKTPSQKNKYLAFTNDVDDLIKTYHQSMNELFNKRIAKIMQLANSENEENRKNLVNLLTPPQMEKDSAGLPTKRKPCSAGEGVLHNLSTYCLSLEAVEEYFHFREAMLSAREVAKQKAASDVRDSKKSLLGYGKLLNRIDREMDIGRQTLDQALAAYNELQMAFPLHLKYREVIGALEKYRDQISLVRKEVDHYPSAFLDVSTTACL